MTESPLPALTTEQMREVDRLMINEYGIVLMQMMENAGRNLASLTGRRLGGNLLGKHIVVACGAGNNGGGGLVAARHLSNWGAEVVIILARSPEQFKEVPEHQWRALTNLPVARRVFDIETPINFGGTDAIVDTLIGYGLNGNPHDPEATLIQQMNASETPIVALDAPSGLNTTTGSPGEPCIAASATLTLALPKTGLITNAARTVVGDLYLGDISVPPTLYADLDLDVPPIFAQDSVLLLSSEGHILD